MRPALLSAILPNPADAAWFACLGLPLTPADLSAARAYLEALGYPPETSISAAADWRQAEAIARATDWDRTWWMREEQERERLMDVAREKLGRDALLERLTAVTALASQAICAAAAIAAERDAIADAALVRAASGAAAMALHGAALARLAGHGREHLFVRKCTLFEAGRWLLGGVGGVFYLF